MKKFILFALCLTFLASASLFMVGCKNNNKHTHSFTVETVADKYLSSAATCTQKAKYFYSCKCGEKGTETFEYGDALGHKFTHYVSGNDATCTSDGTKTAKCDRCDETDTITDTGSKLGHSFTNYVSDNNATCTEDGTKTAKCDRCDETDTVADVGSKLPHTYDRQVMTDKYLCSKATCTQKAKYFYSCKCGEKGTETFEYGGYGDHTYASEWSSDKSKHWHASTCIHNARKDEESHNFVNNICAKCEYDRSIKVSSITLSKTELSISVGDAIDLIATILPDNATDKTVIWTSSSPNVIKVEKGKITAIAKGSAIITATAGGLSATCSVEVTEDFLFASVGNNYAVTAYIGGKSVVVVPTKYNGKSVTMIGERAFYDCSQITEIVLPDTIKEIGVEAFGYCTSLTKIDIAACTRLKDKAFIGCTALTEIYLPDGLVSIGTSPFAECILLTKITIESGTISNSVFDGNKYIKEIVLGSGVTEIAQNAFKGCFSLESLTIPRVDENNVFSNYYFGITPKKYTMSGSGSDNLYPEETKAYTYKDSNGVSHVFGIPLDGTDWYYDGRGVTYNGLYYSYKNEPIIVNSWENYYEITVGVSYKKPKTWSANFYYAPDVSLKMLIVTDQVISIYDDVFTGLNCKIEIKQKFPIKSVTLVGNSEVYIDELDFDNYLLKVTYTDGFSEKFPFDVKYLQNDLEELQTAGEKILNLNYNGVDGEFKITLKLHVFSDVYMDDSIVVADGSPKNLTVKGVPEGTVISYENNGQTQVGEYTVTATLTKEYYETKVLTATLKIRQEKYNIIYVLDNIATNDNPNEYYYGQPLTLNAPISKDGKFIAWYTDEDYSNLFSGITTTTYGDLKLYAKWSAYYNVSDNCITGLTETGKNLSVIDIPAEIAGVTITSIGGSAFSGCKNITSVIIPDSVTSIGSYAFYGCSGLTSITIPDSVTSIGSSAFFGCSGLTSVTIGNSVTSISKEVFYNCSGLTSVTIGNSVTSIGSSAFYNCSELTSVTIPDSVTSIGSSAFFGCSGLTSVTIGNSVTSISKEVFYNCSGLTSITIPDSVTSIGDSAFSGCSGLKSVNYLGTIDQWAEINFNNYSSNPLCYAKKLYINNELVTEANLSTTTKISAYAFYNCSGLTSVTIGKSVTSIEEFAFSVCSGLTSITIPDSVTSIDNYAFSRCSRLTSVTIPDSVTSIGNGAFFSCSGLTSVIWNAENCTSTGSKDNPIFEGCSNLSNVTIGDNVKRIPYYAFSGCSGIKSVIIHDSVTSIGNGAFSRCSGLTSVIWNAENCTNSGYSNCPIFQGCSNLRNVTIGDNVKRIPDYAFYGCSRLTSVTIPDSVTSIDAYAFYGCSGLTSITIPDSVTSIDNYAFSECSGLTSVTIGNSVTSIGICAFKNCGGLTSVIWNAENCANEGSFGWPIFEGCSNLSNVTIGDNVKRIPDYAFEDCSGLTSIEIPDSVTSIGGAAFFNCSRLTSVTIGNGVISIDSSAFSGCSRLTSVTIGNSVTSIGIFAFYNCSGLTSIEIPDSVTSIGYEAFYGCSGLTSITIGNGVISIDSSAFGGCSRLTSVTIGNSVMSIGGSAFYKCSNLTSITIPSSVTSIGNSAFKGCENLTSIYFKGTKSQWNAIKKSSDWNYDTGSYTVYCTDGTIKE